MLLGKNEPIRVVYKKRVAKFALILLVISLVYWLYAVTRLEQSIDFVTFLRRLYNSDMHFALWYLYSYLAMLMMLPLLRRLAQAMQGKEFVYMAAMSLVVVGLIPMAEYRLTQGEFALNPHLQGALFTASNVVYVLMGYYIERVMPRRYRTKKWVLIGVAASAAAILLTAYMTLYRANITGVLNEGSQTYFSSLIALPVYTMYAGAKTLFERVNLSERWKKVLTTVAGTTFGVYLLEGILRSETKFIVKSLRVYIKTFPACIVWVICCMTIGVVLVYLLKKIPLVKKLF